MIDTFDVPKDGALAPFETLLDGSTPVRLLKGKHTLAEFRPHALEQARLLAALIEHGVCGLVAVPRNAAECESVRACFLEWVRQRDDAIQQVVERFTADDDLRQTLRNLVIPATSVVVLPTNTVASD